MKKTITTIAFALFFTHVYALDVNNLTNSEASGGLKSALIQGAGKAVSKLSAVDGFFKNKDVKIPLPENLKKIDKVMRIFGMGRQADDLVLKMNRAAEEAVPEARTLLVNAIKKMSLSDAKAILTGGDDAATQYFKKATSGPMAEKFLPILTKATEKVQLAQQYNKLAAMASQYGLVKKEEASLEQYVTQKTLDGVYVIMAQEEVAIRKDPVGQANGLIKRVFGAISQ